MQYHESVGACRGGSSPGNSAGKQYFSGLSGRDCRNRCDSLSTCTGYVLPVSGSNWCETYTSVGASGDGRTSYKCYMKGIYIVDVHLST